MAEDDIKPRLGRSLYQKDKQSKPFLHKVIAHIKRSGSPKRPVRAYFSGSTVRGSITAALLQSRGESAAQLKRSVITKTRIVKLEGKGVQNAKTHLRYLQRDGAARDGEEGHLYSEDREGVDGNAFMDRSKKDRHQFRIIISPEDSHNYEDLKPLTRRFVHQMQDDLKTKLEWVAADHYNTGIPHTHVIVRGINDKGQSLIIARDYLTFGVRERVAELISIDLGPRTDLESTTQLRKDTSLERFTNIDKELLKQAEQTQTITPIKKDLTQQILWTSRLRKLEDMGLAQQTNPSTWQLHEQTGPILHNLSRRADIISLMHGTLSDIGLQRSAADFVICGPEAPLQHSIKGELIAHGLSDAHANKHFIIIDAVDGRTYYIDIGRAGAFDRLFKGCIIEISTPPASTPGRKSSETITLKRLSQLTLDQQIYANGVTWLDRESLCCASTGVKDSGFGHKLMISAQKRRDWLIGQGIVPADPLKTPLQHTILDRLKDREIASMIPKLSRRFERPYTKIKDGCCIDGKLKGSLDLISGKFGVLHQAHAYTLVPWQPSFNNFLGKDVQITFGHNHNIVTLKRKNLGV